MASARPAKEPRAVDAIRSAIIAKGDTLMTKQPMRMVGNGVANLDNIPARDGDNSKAVVEWQWIASRRQPILDVYTGAANTAITVKAPPNLTIKVKVVPRSQDQVIKGGTRLSTCMLAFGVVLNFLGVGDQYSHQPALNFSHSRNVPGRPRCNVQW